MDSLRSIGNQFSKTTKHLSQGVTNLSKKPLGALARFNFAQVAAIGWLAAQDMLRNSSDIKTLKAFSKESLKNLLSSQNNFIYELRLNQLNWDDLSIKDWHTCIQTLAKELATNGPLNANAKKLFDHLMNDESLLSKWHDDDLLGIFARGIMDQYPTAASRETQEQFLQNIEIFFDKTLPLDPSLMGKLIGRLSDKYQNDLNCKKCCHSLNITYNPKNPLQNWLLNGRANEALRPYLDLTLLGGWVDVRHGQTTPENYSKYVDPATRGVVLPAVAGQSLVEKWNSFKAKELVPNAPYAPIATEGFKNIDDFIEAFSTGEAQTPKDILKRIQNHQPVAILISLPTHKMSITIADGFLIMTNLGGSFGLADGVYKQNNPLLGSMIFQLPTPLPDFINEDWIHDLQNDKKDKVKFQKAIDQFYDNLTPIGAVNKRGQNRGNCVLDHHKVILENFLLIAACKNQALDTNLLLDEDTHGTTSLEHFDKDHDYSISDDKRIVNVRKHKVPIINHQKHIQAARNIYRDITTDIRIRTVLDVVNQENLIDVVSGTFAEDKKAAAKRWLLATVERATENLVRFANQRFAKKSTANKDATIATATFNTLHSEGTHRVPVSLLKDLLESNLSEESILAQRTKKTLEGCLNFKVNVNAMTTKGILNATVSETDHLYDSGVKRQLHKLKQVKNFDYKDKTDEFQKIVDGYLTISKVSAIIGRDKVKDRQLLIVNELLAGAIRLELMSKTAAALLVLSLTIDESIEGDVEAAIENTLVPLVRETCEGDSFLNDVNGFLNIKIQAAIQKLDKEKNSQIIEIFKVIDQFILEGCSGKKWIEGLEKMLQPHQTILDDNTDTKISKKLIKKIQKYLIEEAPDHDCKPKAVQELFERLFPTFFVKA